MAYGKNILFLSLFVALNFNIPKAHGLVPGMFIFGDSLADAGTNNYLPTHFKANFPPYGMNYFPEPTGRFCDGRTAFDLIADALNLGLLPPYIQPGANFSKGINFASSGSGILNTTAASAKIFSLSVQVGQFGDYAKSLKAEIGEEEAKTFLEKSIFAITSGANDIIPAAFVSNCSTPNLIEWMTGNYTLALEQLYFHGARKFLLVNVPAIGCGPFLAAKSPTECLDCVNNYAKDFNNVLKNMANEYIEIAYIYEFMERVLQNPSEYGFVEARKPCCGKFDVKCGSKGYTLCQNASNHVFWDYMHWTQEFYQLFFDEIWPSVSSKFIQKSLCSST